MRTEFPEEEMLDRSYRDKVFRTRGGGNGVFKKNGYPSRFAAFFASLYILNILLENSFYLKPTYSLSIIFDLVSFSSFFSLRGIGIYNPNFPSFTFLMMA